MKNPLLKYVMKEEKEDIFHSSAYGKAQNGAGIGAASVQSFRERQAIEANRQKIGNYGSSAIANNMIGNGPRAKTYTPPVRGMSRGSGLSGSSGVSGSGRASLPRRPMGK